MICNWRDMKWHVIRNVIESASAHLPISDVYSIAAPLYRIIARIPPCLLRVSNIWILISPGGFRRAWFCPAKGREGTIQSAEFHNLSSRGSVSICYPDLSSAFSLSLSRFLASKFPLGLATARRYMRRNLISYLLFLINNNARPRWKYWTQTFTLTSYVFFFSFSRRGYS